MSRRSGASIKAILVVGVAGLFVYGVYSYHELHTRLKSSLEKEERLKQQHDSLSAQLQVVYEHKSRLEKSLQSEKQSHQKTKDGYIAERAEIETRFLNDKDDLMNRLKAVNQEHSMLKSQHEDLQSEYAKVQETHLKLEEDHQQVVAQHNQEYEQLKQEKNNEVARHRDSIADIQRKYDDLVAKYNNLVQSEQFNKNQLQQQQQQNFNQQQQLQQQEQLQQNLKQQLQQQNAPQQETFQQQQPQPQQQQQLLFKQQQVDQQNIAAADHHDQVVQEQQGLANKNFQPGNKRVHLVPEPADNQHVPMQVKPPGDSQHPGYHEVKLNQLDHQNDAKGQGQGAEQGQGRLADAGLPDNQHKNVVQQQVFAPVIDQKEEEKHENLGAKPQEGVKLEEDHAKQVIKDDSLKDKKVQANGKFDNWQGPGPQGFGAKEKIEAPDGVGDAAGKVNQIHLPNVNDDGDTNYDGPEGKEGLGGALGQNLVEEGEEGQVERPGLNLPQFPNQNQENQVQQPRGDRARKNGPRDDDVYKDKEDDIDDKKDDQYNEDDDDDNADNQENDAA